MLLLLVSESLCIQMKTYQRDALPTLKSFPGSIITSMPE